MPLSVKQLLLGWAEEPWRRNRLALNISVVLFYGSLTAIMPFIPYYVRDLGIRGEARIASWAGFLITVGPLLSALMGPLWGRLGDRYGMKPMVERCMLAQALHWFFFAFAQNVYHLLILRILVGLSGGLTSFAIPLLVSTTPKAHISRSIGILQTMQMLASAAGPLFGGLLADAIGIRNTCLVSATITVAALALIRMLYKETPQPHRPNEKSPSAASFSWRSALALPGFALMLLVTFFVTFVERSFSPIVALYVLKLGTSLTNAAKTAGLIISLGLLSEAIAATVMGNKLKTGSAMKLLRWRLLGGVVASFPMGLVWTTSQFFILRLLLGFLAGGCIVVVYTLASQIIPKETRATSFSFMGSAAMLGGAAGPIAAGQLAFLNLRAIFFCNSIVFLLLLIYSLKRMPASSHPPDENTSKQREPIALGI